MHKLKDNAADFGLLWLRVLMGLGIAHHGYGKVFGGYIAKLTEGLTQMGFPAPEVFAWAAALSEFAGGICVALGLFTRPAAFFIFVTMAVAAFVAHRADPLDVKELALAYFTIAGALVFLGAGKFSLDHLFKRKPGGL